MPHIQCAICHRRIRPTEASRPDPRVSAANVHAANLDLPARVRSRCHLDCMRTWSSVGTRNTNFMRGKDAATQRARRQTIVDGRVLHVNVPAPDHDHPEHVPAGASVILGPALAELCHARASDASLPAPAAPHHDHHQLCIQDLDHPPARPAAHMTGARVASLAVPVDVFAVPMVLVLSGVSAAVQVELVKVYEVESLLGVGGFGTVFKCRRRHVQLGDASVHVPVAVKFLSSCADAAVEYNHFLSVGHHDNIVTCHRMLVLPDDLGALLELEFVPTPSYTSLVRSMQGPHNFDMIQRYFSGVLRGLHAIHSKNTVHRDIKFPNIVADATCSQVKLIDLGLASTVKSEDMEFKAVDQALQLLSTSPLIMNIETHLPPLAHAVLVPSHPRTWGDVRVLQAGTRGYRPPESLARSRFQTQAMDLWSTGVLLLQVMTGRTGFFVGGAPNTDAAGDADARLDRNNLFALAELTWVFGKQAVDEVMQCFQRKLVFDGSPFATRTAVSLRGIVNSLNHGHCWPDAMFDLLARLLDLNPRRRITEMDALDHSFFAQRTVPSSHTDVHVPTASRPACAASTSSTTSTAHVQKNLLPDPLLLSALIVAQRPTVSLLHLTKSCPIVKVCFGPAHAPKVPWVRMHVFVFVMR